nr:MAG TPA: hypothetical protein [Caudoviricetes sp.]
MIPTGIYMRAARGAPGGPPFSSCLYIRSRPGKGLAGAVWYTAPVLRCNSGEPGTKYLTFSIRRR